MILPLLIFVGIIVVDQVTKMLARTWLAPRPPIIFGEQLVEGGIARLTYFENPGAFLGLGADLPPAVRFWVFTVVAILLLVALIIYTWRSAASASTMTLVGVTLLVAGGIDNLIDRIFNDGRVIDFMQVGVGWLRTGVFNIADMALMAGVGVAVLAALRQNSSPIQEPSERESDAMKQ